MFESKQQKADVILFLLTIFIIFVFISSLSQAIYQSAIKI